tara:strand:+ start:120 stop:290 length:171 start_codon:yes stop_codon:yes gene_type:complete
MENPTEKIQKILDKVEEFDYEELDVLVYHIQGKQIEMFEDIREESLEEVERTNCNY